jgi:hypothetical protein
MLQHHHFESDRPSAHSRPLPAPADACPPASGRRGGGAGLGRGGARVRLAQLCLLAGLLIGGAGAVGAGEDPGWRTLFNGTNLTGWTLVNDGVFAVKDGLLHVAKGMGWLRTDKEYGDFVIDLEWRALETNYNSGVFVRCGLEGKPFPPEGWQVNLKEKGLGSLMRGNQAILPAAIPPMPTNQWVKFRIEVRGPNLTLDVDGKRVMSYAKLDRVRGFVGLQAEGKAMDFRDIRIRELPAARPGE